MTINGLIQKKDVNFVLDTLEALVPYYEIRIEFLQSQEKDSSVSKREAELSIRLNTLYSAINVISLDIDKYPLMK